MSASERDRSEPTADAVEALVRAIEIKETGGTAASRSKDVRPAAPRTSPTPPEPAAPLEPTTAGPAGVPIRPGIVVASDPTRSLRGATPGLIDRQLWEGLVVQEAQRQRRYRRPAALVLAEIEGLETLVQRMGPGALARLIPPCAALLVSVARESDRIARLTTARFGILLVESEQGGAARYAARATVAADRWFAESPWHLRLLVGWATIEPDSVFRAMRDAEAHLRARQR